MRMKRHHILMLASLAVCSSSFGQAIEWPEVRQEAKPGTRWWWLGSAVDSANLTYNLEEYAKAGIGAVEITPIYGVVGNEANDIDYLTDRWMGMLGHTEKEGQRLGVQIDMNNGTGWPFGGPTVPLEEAASRAIFHVWRTGEQEPALTEKEQKGRPQLQGIYTYPIAGTEHYGKIAKKGKVTLAPDGQMSKKFPDVISMDSIYVALYVGHTLQQVKRAAPGGEGYVMDHLNPTAVSHYLSRFDEAFSRTGTAIPHTFFNDSYEVYDADWTPALLTEFERRRGYKLQDHFPDFLDTTAADHRRLISDYRETMSDLLLEVFTRSWADWAHRKGAKVRNQAHGSPANLLDVYASVDIPEIEGYGLSDFGITGLRTDSLWKVNDSDLSMLKYASSAAHVTGKPFTSSETFTWLTEHFRTSLSQCKPDFDLMMVGGVNHIYFHGTTYSPKEAEWPGHLFYASMEMSPINTIWRDAPAFMQYVTRVQSFMQWGKPDNDLLMYMPVYDMWHDNPGRLLMFAIHGMEKKSPKFVNAVMNVYNAGYDMDYLSDRMLEKTTVDNGRIRTEGNALYRALVLPEVRFMQPSTLEHLVKIAREGATIIFVGGYPAEVPGLSDLQNRSERLTAIRGELPAADASRASVTTLGKGRIVVAKTYQEALALCNDIRPESMKSRFGLKSIRRSNPNGYHYFISSLQPKGVDGWVALGVPAKSAVIFNPLTGQKGVAQVRDNNGVSEVRLQLASGESCILQTFDQPLSDADQNATGEWTYSEADPQRAIDLTTLSWAFDASQLQGRDSVGLIPARFTPKSTEGSPLAWTQFEGLKNTMGTATYTATINLSRRQLDSKLAGWILDLGDVRESAHVWINGKDAGTAFSVPYQLNVSKLLRVGKNEIRIEVTSLAANYIAQMDRDKKVWRRFKNANIAPLPGTTKESNFSGWGTIPCGLNSQVRLVPMIYK